MKGVEEEDKKRMRRRWGKINIVDREGIRERGGKIIKLWRRE